MASIEDDSRPVKLESACSDLKNLLASSAKLEESLGKMDKKFDAIDEALSTASRRIAPLQTLSMATKALDARINCAVSPALALLDAFKRSESLQYKLLDIHTKLSSEKTPEKRLKMLIKYVDCADKLHEAVNSISREGEPVIQEVVEFLSRKKATDPYRAHRLRETLITLKALYETEVDAMRFEGLLDEALLNRQDEYESILQILKHQNILKLQAEDDDGNDDDQDRDDDATGSELGTELEIEILRKISESLDANDCLDISIDIYT